MNVGLLEALLWKKASYCLRGVSRCLSQVAAGSLGFLSSCDRDLRDPLLLPRGNQASFQAARGHIGISLELLQWNRASFCVEAGNSVLLSNCTRDLRIPIEFQKGSQASSPF